MAQKLFLQQNLLKAQRRINLEKQGALVSGTEALCFKDCHFELHSKPRRMLELLQLVNLMYIAIATPVHVGFNVEMRGVIMLLESISLAISAIVIFLNFRTPVITRGKHTLALRKVARHYWQNGMLIDLFGVIPLNLLLGSISFREVESAWLVLLLLAARTLRIVSSW